MKLATRNPAGKWATEEVDAAKGFEAYVLATQSAEVTGALLYDERGDLTAWYPDHVSLKAMCEEAGAEAPSRASSTTPPSA